MLVPMPAFMRTRAFLVVALLVSTGLVGGAGYALVTARDDQGSDTNAGASTSPTTSPTPEASPGVTVSPTPDVTVSPTAGASASASASATASATATSSSKTYDYPRSPGYSGLVLTVTNNPGSGPVGTNFELTVKGHDGDGTIYFGGLTWGDGTSVSPDASPQHCKSYPPLTSPPGAYQPQPDDLKNVYHHRFLTPGHYVITVSISCTPETPSYKL